MSESLHHAAFASKMADGRVACLLCPHNCILADQQYGICRVRCNINGEMMTASYGTIAAVHVDPVEKKPLADFMPGTETFSIGTLGCNFDCDWCQNDSLSRSDYRTQYRNMKAYSPREIVRAAQNNGCPSISYTYNEPAVFAEFVIDTAKLAHEQGLKNILVSNGFINLKAAEELFINIDAANFDVKAFTEEVYRQRIHGALSPVLECIRYFYSTGKHLELTMLIVPGVNDDPEEIRNFALWVKNELSPEVIVHFTAFHPAGRTLNVPRTRPDTLFAIRSCAEECGLKNIRLGNI